MGPRGLHYFPFLCLPFPFLSIPFHSCPFSFPFLSFPLLSFPFLPLFSFAFILRSLLKALGACVGDYGMSSDTTVNNKQVTGHAAIPLTPTVGALGTKCACCPQLRLDGANGFVAGCLFRLLCRDVVSLKLCFQV